MSNPLNVSLGELLASRETGGPLTLQRSQSGRKTSFHQIITQAKINLPLEWWQWWLHLECEIREGFLGVVIFHLPPEGSVGGSWVRGRAKFCGWEQGQLQGTPKLGGARALEGLWR